MESEADAATIELEAKDKAGLEIAMKAFQAAWNSEDIKKVIAAFHPTAKVAKGFANEQTRTKLETEFKGMTMELGTIEKFEIRKFIEGKKLYVVRVHFSKAGMMAGTYAARKLADGSWGLGSMNIDGQQEPELTE